MALPLSVENGQLLVTIEDADGCPWDYEVSRPGSGALWVARLTKRGGDCPTHTVSCLTLTRLSERTRSDGTTEEIETCVEEWGCTCPDWRFRYRATRKNPGDHCKHILAAKELRRILETVR